MRRPHLHPVAMASLALGVPILLLWIGLGAGAAEPKGAASMTEEEKAFYFLGTMTGRSLGRFSLSDEEMEIVRRGLEDYVAGTAIELDAATYGARLQGLANRRAEALSRQEREESQAFLAAQAERSGVRKLDSGVLIEQLSPGSGDQPTPANTVKVHYHGTLRDGEVFDSSVQRGQPFETPLARVVPCWQQGVSEMKVGEKARLYCPSELAYGDRGSPPKIPGGAALVFEVELLEIVR